MSIAMIAIFALTAWLCAMAGFWCVSWGNTVAGIFVAGVILIGVAVSWQRVEQCRAQDDAAVAAAVASYGQATVPTVPPPDHPRAGT